MLLKIKLKLIIILVLKYVEVHPRCLRLGKKGNTYSKILSNQSIGQIRDFHRSSKTHQAKLQNHIESIEKTIDENITNEGGRFEKINDEKIKKYLNLHLKYNL